MKGPPGTDAVSQEVREVKTAGPVFLAMNAVDGHSAVVVVKSGTNHLP